MDIEVAIARTERKENREEVRASLLAEAISSQNSTRSGKYLNAYIYDIILKISLDTFMSWNSVFLWTLLFFFFLG